MPDANTKTQNNFVSLLKSNLVAIGAVFIVLLLIFPIKTVLLDVFMAMNLAFSILILITVISTPRPASLTTFPQLVLLITLFGLGINVSSTRLILSQGAAFDGRMVRTFSSFVVGSSKGSDGLAIGFVIFIILIVIQVIVITKGATRVSEVAARFALESMPQKNFAVDQEVNAGSITEEEARKKRAEIRTESDFFSAMDGSSKFVSGNVYAGIFITVVNLVAGIIVGMVLHKESWSVVLEQYPRLTIGDGLLSQIPSLLLSFSTGLLVTKIAGEETLNDSIKEQFASSAPAFYIGGAAMALLGFVPGMPWYVLVPLGGLSIYLGRMFRMKDAKKIAAKAAEAEEAARSGQTGHNPSEISPVVPVHVLQLELGYGLLALVDQEKGAKLLDRIDRIRREIGLDLGLVFPDLHVVDNMTLDPSEYSFKIRGIEAGRAKLRMNHYMAINAGGVTAELQGESAVEPAFGLPAVWISEDERGRAERSGYAVVDPPTVIATHLTEVIRNHAADILDRSQVKNILDKVSKTNEIVVEEVLNTGKFSYGQIEKVLKNLLHEKVSIRNMDLILETLADFTSAPGPWVLTEKVRETLGKQICMQYADENHVLKVMNLSEDWANKVLTHMVLPPDGSRPYVGFDPVDGRKWISSLSSAFAAMSDRGVQPVVMCPSQVRALVKVSTEREMPGLAVLSVNELMVAGNSISLEVLGEVALD